MNIGRHELILSNNDFYNAFPFFNDAVDSERFFRYVTTDSSGWLSLILTPFVDLQSGNTYLVNYLINRVRGLFSISGYYMDNNNNFISTEYLIEDSLTVIEALSLIAKNFKLYQNCPNPFNPSTKISCSLQSEVGYL